MIRGLLFDYGGTIDTNGIHWAEVLWESYQSLDLSVPKPLFAQAYAFGERSLAIHPLVKPEHNFYDVLGLKVEQQFNFLRDNGYDLDRNNIDRIAKGCNEIAIENVQNAKSVLIELQQIYPLVMVSNFYGNLQTVLTDFGIIDLFQSIVESAVAGVRKPNPEIYRLGVEALGLPANECLVIGDSFSKDIKPAKQTGCKAVWLNKKGWEEDESVVADLAYQPDGIISDFKDLPAQIREIG